MASGSRKPLSEFACFQYNFETSFVADALLDPILSQLPLHGLETNCIDPGVLAQIDPSKHTWKNFPREMLLLGDDMKEWMEEDGQAEKENIPSSKRMKSDHSKIQFGTKVSTDKEIAKASKGFVPPNTAATTRWAIGNFNAWREWRNEMNPDNCVPENLFESGNSDELNKWLSLYVRETR